jgi:hypothetical protein
MKKQTRRRYLKVVWAFALLIAAALLFPIKTNATGTWVPLANQAPDSIGVAVLLSDGTVMCSDASASSTNWYRLTPDEYGSYVNGTWSTLASSHFGRALFAADVVPDGRVFIAGGEYGTGITNAEIYDPVANQWSVIDPPTSLFDPSQGDIFDDMISIVIPDGNVLMAPVTPKNYGGTLIYNPQFNVWSNGPTLTNGDYNQDECGWVNLADGSILTVDGCAQTSQRYIPSLNQWIPDSTVPVFIWNTVGSGCEIGPALTLPNGEAFYAAGSGSNALYAPSGNNSPGIWKAGPVFPNHLEAADSPGAVMVNGKVLLAVATNCFNGGCLSPWYYYEYDYTAGANGSLTQVSAPTVGVNSNFIIPWMLDLPDGSVLLSLSLSQLNVYQPVGLPQAAWKPVISSITPNADGSFHLVGTGLNGVTEGANEGDDGQMASDYPLVRMTNNSSGFVYYGRTYNWSSTTIQTGSTPESTEFKVPTGIPPGSYSLVVVANGIASDPVTFYGPVWVDFTSVCPAPLGYFDCSIFGGGPYPTLAEGVTAVSSGGNIFVKPGSSTETTPLTISKPMTIAAPLGPATIGQ